jgi:uncharacterized membrane protein
MSGKPSFVVLLFPSRDVAQEALRLLEGLARDKALALRDAAIVVHTEQGRVELEQTQDLSTGQGTIAGGVAGMLLGLALGGVVAVALTGMAGGGIFGSLDTGIENKRLRGLGEQLEPGQAALGALIEEADWPRVRDAFRPLAGEPIVVELSDEALAAVEKASDDG